MSNVEILREFLLETHENLGLLDSDLVALEKNPTDKSTLAQVFRTLHSVKGTAGFMGLVKLQAVAHSAESLLSKLRLGELRFNPTIATAMLRVVDAIREMLSSIEETGDEGAGDYSAVIAEVDRLREGEDTVSTVALPPPSAQLAPSAVITPPPIPAPVASKVSVAPAPAPVVAPAPLVAPATAPTSAPSPTTAPVPVSAPVLAPGPAPASRSPKSSETIVSLPPEGTGSNESRSNTVLESNVRIEVGLLDNLMTLVGELVLARNQIMQYSASHEDDGFLGAVQRLNLLTTELQASVMKTRMQPIGNVLGKFPRIVRDLSIACGKKVRFEAEGQDTELDKTLLEAIRDPLTHMVRNAIDHGIETPEVRRALGKAEEGRLRMVAYHEGGKVVIEITDDGSGINVDRVREKALASKLVTAEEIARMSRQEILSLVFLPGFSTTDRVTQFSGRGVGMDVVRTNMEKIGGTVDIESTPGQGTTIRTKIPLTLAIIPALIIVSGGQRFAIPQVSLLELVRLESEQAARGIERLHGVPVYRLRGNLLPLAFLDEQLQLTKSKTTADELNIVVLQADDRAFGLVVDAIRDTEEIVVKPLQKQLKGISVFAGASIMGEGRVALVLDVLGLAQRANVITVTKTRTISEKERTIAVETSEIQELLLFTPNVGGQMAIPLSRVARLEEFHRSELENLGSRQVVQYRGDILPLIDVSDELESLQGGGPRIVPNSKRRDSHSTSDMIAVVVCSVDNKLMGLIVHQILDTVQDSVAVRSRANRPGILFTAIIQNKVTEFLDLNTVMQAAIDGQSFSTDG